VISEKSPNQTLKVVGNSQRLADPLIRAREAILNGVSRAERTRAVNHLPGEMETPPGADLASNLKLTLDELKRQFMDEDGLRVDYGALSKSESYAKYKRECQDALQRFDPHSLQTENARRAFWINLYNALIIDAVVTFKVKESVVGGLLGIVTFFRRAAYVVGGMRVSLEDMEQGILRGNRGNPFLPGAHFASNDERLTWAIPLDPRVHFALNCGSRSCPPIRSYKVEKLDEQLNLATRGFVSQDVSIQTGESEVQLSRIFRWYQADFNGRSGLIDFLIKYLPDDERRSFLVEARGNARLKFKTYDWRLNQI